MFLLLMARSAAALGMLALATTMIAGCTDRLPDQDLRIMSTPAAAKMPADVLWKAFKANPSAAARQYFGKAVEISGTVTSVGSDVPGQRYVLFGQDDKNGVRANLLDDHAREILAGVAVQNRVTLRCFCEGLQSDLILKSCFKP
jgi:hypothetical protein